jgi:hypothetical protein
MIAKLTNENLQKEEIMTTEIQKRSSELIEKT